MWPLSRRVMEVGPSPPPPASAEEALRRIVEGTAADTGRDFFRSLVRHLAGALGVRWALVGELARPAPSSDAPLAPPPHANGNGNGSGNHNSPSDERRVNVLAVWDERDADFAPNFDYDLAGTPCQGVIDDEVHEHRQGVAGRFPDDPLLARLGVESYAGVQLMDTSGEPLGLLAVMHDRPLDELPLARHAVTILRVFAARAAAELRRLRREEALHRACDSLRDSQRRYQVLADVSPVGIFHTDADGDVTYVNRRWSQIAGLQPDEALGQGWARRLHPEDRERVLSENGASRRTGTPFQAEYRFVHDDGRVVWVFGQAQSERDDGGRVVGFVGTVTDITQRKFDEQQLRDSERRYHALADSSAIGIWQVTMPGGFTLYLNPTMRRMLELDDGEDLAGQPFHPFFTPQSLERVKAELPKRANGLPGTYEVELVGRRGARRTAVIAGTPVVGPDGKVHSLIGAFTDITERRRTEQALLEARDQLEGRVRKRTEELEAANEALRREIDERKAIEEELRQNQQRYASILNSQQTLISRSDPGGRITYVNAAHQRTFGSKVSDSVLAKVHPDDVEATKRAMEDLTRAPYTFTLEQRCEVRGQWRTFLWQGGVIRDRTGKVVEYQGVGFDITDRKRAEEMLHDSMRRAREAADKSRENAERARRAAEEAHQVAEFNRRLALEVDHRVRNNLAGLLSLVGVMKERSRDVRSFATAIEGRLLAMHHVHQALADTEYRGVDLKSLVSSLLAAVEKLAPYPARARVDGPSVPVPPRLTLPLSMILVEWFTNSCKYGAHSGAGGRLRVKWEVVNRATDEKADVRHVRLRWQEFGGPAILGPVTPSLGTDLVRGFASRELAGRCELCYPVSGVDHMLEFPVE